MTLNRCFKISSLILATALITVLGLSTDAVAQKSPYLIDLNTGTVTPLGNLGGTATYAYSINDAGQVVGESLTAEGYWHAFITGPNGVGRSSPKIAVNFLQPSQ